MSKADVEYKKLVDRILSEGYSNEHEDVRTVWADGTSAYTISIAEHTMTFKSNEVPIITSKRVAWKTAIKEILWIWQMQSNNVSDLQDMNVKIWNEWTDNNNTIGKAYGYQLGKKVRELNGEKVNQVDYLIHQIKNNPNSRRLITSLWNIDDLDEMMLEPCVWTTQWIIKGNKLNLFVRARSNDVALGLPFNIFQYSVLHRMIAQVTGCEVGDFIYSIGDAHIYHRHIAPIISQIESETFTAPTLWINPEVKDFYDFTMNDFKLINYNHGKKVNMEVAI